MRTLSLLLTLTMIGCTGSDELDRVWTSEHFVYRSRVDDDSVCEEVLDTLEAHRAEVLTYLGLDPDARSGPIEYRKYRDRSDLEAHGACPGRAACAIDDTVWTYLAVHEHELIHVHMGSHAPHPLLSEGVATALGCSPSGLVPEELELVDLLTWNDDVWLGTELFRGAAVLVAHLLRTRGPEAFLAWYEAVSRSAGPDEIRRKYEETYGSAIEDAWTEATATRDRSAICIPLWPDAQPRVGAGEWSLNEACDGSDRYRAFTVPPGSLLHWASDEPLWLTLDRIDDGESGVPIREHGSTAGRVVGAQALEPGDYYFRSGLVDDGHPVWFDPQAEGGLGVNCETLGPLSLAPHDVSAWIDLPPNGQIWFIRIALPEAYPVSVIAPEGFTNLTSCESCDPASCEPMPFYPASVLHPGADLLLRVETTSIPEGYHRVRIDYLRPFESGT